MCDKDYTPSLGFACNKCSDDAASIAVAALVALVSVLLVVGAFVYAMSGKDRGLSTRTGKKIMATCMRRLNSMKILIIVWQIITQVRSGTRSALSQVDRPLGYAHQTSLAWNVSEHPPGKD